MDAGLLSARIADTADLCVRTSVPRFLGFLSSEEAAVADSRLKSGSVRYEFFGGYPDAERRLLACIPEWCDHPEYPITAFTFSFRECDSLCHRDFLGSLLALGIERETVGDILCEKGRTVAFVRNEVASFISTQLERVGRVGVTIATGFVPPLPQPGQLVSASDTVASMRLDCIVSALGGFSRSAACEMIENGYVTVNSLCVQKATHTVVRCDRISIRGKGKFHIVSADEFSKKGRVILRYETYR